MPSIWDDPPNPPPRPPQGMLDDAYRRQQALARLHEEQQAESQALATRQRAEIAEFLAAMRQLGISTRTYQCYYLHEDRRSHRRVQKPASEVIRGWHVGDWSPEEIVQTNLPWKGRPGWARTTYLVVSEVGELRSTSVDGRFGKTVPIQLPYYLEDSSFGDRSPPSPHYLSNALRMAVHDIVQARSGQA